VGGELTLYENTSRDQYYKRNLLRTPAPPFNPLESIYSMGQAQKVPCISRVIDNSLSTAHLRCRGEYALLDPIFSKAIDRARFSG